MKVQHLYVEEGVRYLPADLLLDLKNVIVDKGPPGAGATHSVITNNRNELFVLLLPTIAAVDNKCDKHSNTIRVHGTIKSDTILSGLNTEGKNIIVSTYDGISKVVNALGDEVSQWRIVIDESHEVLMSGTYRHTALELVKKNYLKFKDFIFVSATPGTDTYFSKTFNYVKINWPEGYKRKLIKAIKVDKDSNITNVEVRHAMYKIEELLDEGFNVHLFMNNVKDMSVIYNTLIKQGILDNEDICLVASKGRNDIELLMPKIEHSKFNDGRKLSFYTSSGFSSIDIDDENGRVIIVTKRHSDVTNYVIDIDIIQIAGRLRANEYNNDIYWIYSAFDEYTANKESLTTALLDLKIDRLLVKSHREVLDTLETPKEKASANAGFVAGRFRGLESTNNSTLKRPVILQTKVDSTIFVINENENTKQFLSNLNVDDGVHHINEKLDIVKIEDNVDLSNVLLDNERHSWKDHCRMYCKAVSDGIITVIDRYESDRKYKVLIEVYKIGGLKLVTELKEHKGRMIAYLEQHNEDSIPHNQLIGRHLRDAIELNTFISRAETKSIISDIKKELGIPGATNSNEFMEYYLVKNSKPIQKRVGTKKISGYIPLMFNIQLKY